MHPDVYVSAFYEILSKNEYNKKACKKNVSLHNCTACFPHCCDLTKSNIRKTDSPSQQDTAAGRQKPEAGHTVSSVRKRGNRAGCETQDLSPVT